MSKNKFRYTVHKWIDIGSDQLEESLLLKIKGLEIYKDTVLIEHIYGIDTVRDYLQETGKIINAAEQSCLDTVQSYLIAEDAGYFRIIFS